MRIVDGPMQAPNVCLICEQHPDVSFVDTFCELQSPDRFHPLMGRKYVCALCLKQLADVAGFEHSSEVKQAREFLRLTQQRLVELRQKMSLNTQDILETFHNLPDAAVMATQLVFTPNEIKPTLAELHDRIQVRGPSEGAIADPQAFVEALKAEVEEVTAEHTAAIEAVLHAPMTEAEVEAYEALVAAEQEDGEPGEIPLLSVEELLGEMPIKEPDAEDEPVIVDEPVAVEAIKDLAHVIEEESAFKPQPKARRTGARPKAGS